MLEALTDLLQLCCVVIVAVLALLGWGRLAWVFLAGHVPARLTSGLAWLGYSLVSAVVELVHLFLPVDWKVTALVAAVGLASVAGSATGAASLRDLGQRLAALIRRNTWQSALLLCLVAVWCLRAMSVPNNYDSGLYHFQSIRWINEEPVVFGLGNLHWRLALNQSYFGFLGLMNLAPLWNKGYSAGGVVLLVLTLATLIETGLSQSWRWRCVVGSGLLIFMGVVAGSVASPSPDNAVALLEVVIFLFLYRVLQSASRDDAGIRQSRVVVLFLCIAVICIKFSSAAFALGCIAVLVWRAWRDRAISAVASARVTVIAGMMLAVHLLRAMILSGAPLFPSPLFGAWQLEWAVPAGVAHAETAFIRNWAKLPGVDIPAQALAGWAWTPDWLARQSAVTLTLFAAGGGLMLLNLAWRLGSRRGRAGHTADSLYVPLVASLLFWFFTAPDARFLGAVLILFFLLSCDLTTASIESMAASTWPNRTTRFRTLMMALFALVCAASLRNVGLASLSFTGWKPLPHTETVAKRTNSDVIVFLPETGNQCWNAPLPCASLFNADLRQSRLLGHLLYTVKPD